MSDTASRDDIRMDCIQAALEFEQDLAKHGKIPDRDRLPHKRARPVFEIVGAVMLSLGIAGISLFGAFFVFNVILHWDF